MLYLAKWTDKQLMDKNINLVMSYTDKTMQTSFKCWRKSNYFVLAEPIA